MEARLADEAAQGLGSGQRRIGRARSADISGEGVGSGAGGVVAGSQGAGTTSGSGLGASDEVGCCDLYVLLCDEQRQNVSDLKPGGRYFSGLCYQLREKGHGRCSSGWSKVSHACVTHSGFSAPACCLRPCIPKMHGPTVTCTPSSGSGCASRPFPETAWELHSMGPCSDSRTGLQRQVALDALNIAC